MPLPERLKKFISDGQNLHIDCIRIIYEIMNYDVQIKGISSNTNFMTVLQLRLKDIFNTIGGFQSSDNFNGMNTSRKLIKYKTTVGLISNKN